MSGNAFFLGTNGYEIRANALKELGFRDYNEYLKSRVWSGIRQQVTARCERRCEACLTPGVEEFHHLRYDKAVLDGSDISGILALCSFCHDHAEFKEGHKVDLVEANQRLREIWRSVNRGESVLNLRIRLKKEDPANVQRVADEIREKRQDKTKRIQKAVAQQFGGSHYAACDSCGSVVYLGRKQRRKGQFPRCKKCNKPLRPH
jgi:hypothetical protein